jgi:hypothetical protein
MNEIATSVEWFIAERRPFNRFARPFDGNAVVFGSREGQGTKGDYAEGEQAMRLKWTGTGSDHLPHLGNSRAF